MIGGNTTAWIECSVGVKNDIGESRQVWEPVGKLTGWLDLMGSGNGPIYTTYSAAIAESTHLFLADYDATIAAAKHKTCRAMVNGQYYAVQLIDDPMDMHRQLEIYLKHTGGQVKLTITPKTGGQ